MKCSASEMASQAGDDASWKKAVNFNRLGVEKKRRAEEAVARLGKDATTDKRVQAACEALKSIPNARSLPKALKEEVWISFFGEDAAKGACHICAAMVRNTAFQLGHRTSRFNGGGDEPSNLVVLCHACNQSQGTDNLEDFLVRLGREGREKQREEMINFLDLLVRNPHTHRNVIPGLVADRIKMEKRILEELRNGCVITEGMMTMLQRWGYRAQATLSPCRLAPNDGIAPSLDFDMLAHLSCSRGAANSLPATLTR